MLFVPPMYGVLSAMLHCCASCLVCRRALDEGILVHSVTHATGKVLAASWHLSLPPPNGPHRHGGNWAASDGGACICTS